MQWCQMPWCQNNAMASNNAMVSGSVTKNNITILSVSRPTRLQLKSYQQVPVVAFYRHDAAAPWPGQAPSQDFSLSRHFFRNTGEVIRYRE
jgi:hypothetical protein